MSMEEETIFAAMTSQSQQQQNPPQHPQQQQQPQQSAMNGKMMSENFSPDPHCMEKMYHWLDELGSGGFGKVKLAIHILTGERVAVKIIDKKAIASDLPRVTHELAALKQLAHQNICRMFQFVETEEKFFIVMEYCNGGEMFDYIVRKERLGESEARHFFRQLVQAVAYIHSMGFAHRDLKPENLLLTQDLQLKVIDFGLCAKPLNGLSRPLENRSYFGNEADIWSMGVLLYALVCGNLPFDDAHMPRLYRKITSGLYVEPDFLTPLCKQFLRSMLTVDPKRRANIRQILAHPWLNKNYEQQLKWQTIYSREIIDEDVIRELVYFYGTTTEHMMGEIKQWRFDYLTATYLILLQKKERKQNFTLPTSYREANKFHCSPTIHASLDNNLDMSGIESSSNSGTSNEQDSVEKKMDTMTLYTQPLFVHSPQRQPTHQNGTSTTTQNGRADCEPTLNDMVGPRIPPQQQQLQRPTTAPSRTPQKMHYYYNQPGAANDFNTGMGGTTTPRPKSVYTTPRRGPLPQPFGIAAGFVSPTMYRRPNSVERPPRGNGGTTNMGTNLAALATPSGGTQPKQPLRSNSTDRPMSSNSGGSGSGATSPVSGTPSGSEPRMARIDTRRMESVGKSPSRRQRMFSSLERKADKMINLLTPKKIRSEAPTKLKCIKTMVNVSVTSSTDPAQVREELWKVLRDQGMDTTQNGWKICGSKKGAASGGPPTTVELEVVAIEGLQYVGVKRKRIQGDAFVYKRICEEVLRLAGL